MQKIFIETLSKFSDSEDEKLGNEYWGEYTFDLNEVSGYNESSSSYTVIEFKNGIRWEIAIKHDEFKKLMKGEYTHNLIIDSKALYEFNENK